MKSFIYKASGKVSKMNVVNIAVLLAALFDIFKPFIPQQYLEISIAVLAAVNVILRTFYTEEPMKG
jgi:hypothetical protein